MSWPASSEGTPVVGAVRSENGFVGDFDTCIMERFTRRAGNTCANRAARNIYERLEKLRRKERMARQEQTTADMLDVIAGSEAMTHH